MQTYRLIRPSAIFLRLLSDLLAVNTQVRISPFSFPTEVSHSALPWQSPANFLQIFLVESIFKTLPKVDVSDALRCGIDIQMSRTCTASNQAAERGGLNCGHGCTGSYRLFNPFCPSLYASQAER